MDTRDRYIRDIPMELGASFFPRDEIRLPSISLPVLVNQKKYSFDVEKRARSMYDNNKNTPKPVEVTETKNNPSKVEAPLISALLQPSKPTLSAATVSSNVSTAPLSFEDFETKNNIFDELEWHSIDNKQALSQILGTCSTANSAPTTPVPVTAAPSSPSLNTTLPSYPVLSFPNSQRLSSTVQPISQPKQDISSTQKVASISSSSSLRSRLATKGYRENYINSAMQKLPRERLVHIEYYMKGMSTLEKKGAPFESSLEFLIDSKLTDKQEVLDRSSSAANLIGMGFSCENVFEQLVKHKGDKEKALDVLLTL